MKTNHKFSSTTDRTWSDKGGVNCRGCGFTQDTWILTTVGSFPQGGHSFLSSPSTKSVTLKRSLKPRKTKQAGCGSSWWNRKSDYKKFCNNLRHCLLTTFLNPFYFKSTLNRQHPSSVTIRNGMHCDSIPNQDNQPSLFQNFIGFYLWTSPVS